MSIEQLQQQADSNTERLDALKRISELTLNGGSNIQGHIPYHNTLLQEDQKLPVSIFGGNFNTGIDFIPVNIYTGGQGNNIKPNLRFAINDSDPAILTTKSTVFTCTYSVGYTLYKALYAFKRSVGTYGVGGETIALDDLNYIGREVIVDILDPDDLAEAGNIQDSINESSNTFDTSIVNIFRRTIQGEVRVYAYTPENDYQEFIGFGQTPINEEDFTDITGNGNEESDNDITGFNFNTTTGDLTIETSQGGDFVVSLDGRYATAAQGALADTSVQQSDLEPYSKRVDTAKKLSANPSGATLSILDENDNILDTISLGFLNNEGTTLVYNSTDETIEIRNDDNDLLSSIPVSSFVTNVGSNLNISGAQLQLRDDANAILSTVTLGIANINGLQNALGGKATSAQAALANTALQSIPTHTGDVTGDTELTIANRAVTGTKIAIATITGENIAQNAISGQKLEDDTIPGGKLVLNTVTNPRLSKMDGFTIKGNQLASIATPQDLTPSEVKSLLGLDSDYATAAQGALADTSVQLTGDQTINGVKTFNDDTIFNNGLTTGGFSTNRDKGIYGVYNITKWGHIWSIGTDYRINPNGDDPGNLFGAAYRYSANGYGKNHQFVWCLNGIPSIALGSNLWVASKAGIGVENPTERLEVGGNVKADAFIGDLPISSTQGSGVTVTNQSDGLKVVVDSVDTSDFITKTGNSNQTVSGALSATTFIGDFVATGRLAMPDSLPVPSSSTSSGLKGELRYDDDYLYVCINTNSWKRIALTTW
mgnify:CR=1 FL=1